jgi:glycosyltransferase involved in cell wall biosynthesis
MRITIVTGFFLPVPALRGGATEKIWYGLARIFAAAGHSVTLVSRSWPGLERTETVDGVHHVRLPGFDHTGRLLFNVVLDLIWGFRVARALPPGDVVICNTVTLPVWLHLIRPSAGKVAAMVGRVPKGQVRFYWGVDRFYAPSSFVARKIASERASAQTLVTGYPIEWALLARSARHQAPPVTIGFVGRLHPEKGIDLLVRAACILAGRVGLPEWRLRLVGPASVKDGGGGEEWIGALRSRAETALRGRVDWQAPEYDPGRLAAVYGGIDVFCYPSLAENGETFGVSVAEAMAAGCAAVVSALECFKDLVADGQTGLVFDHTAAGADRLLADCIGRLVADAGLRNELALRGQQHVRRFDYAEVSRQILGDLALLTGTGAEKRKESSHA